MRTKYFMLAAVAAMSMLTACEKYNDGEIRENIAAIDNRVTTLEGKVTTIEGAMAALKTVVDKNYSITGFEKTDDGYKLTFTTGETLELLNGEKGDKGDIGDSFFKSVTQSNGCIVIVMNDASSTTYTIPCAMISVGDLTSESIEVTAGESKDITISIPTLTDVASVTATVTHSTGIASHTRATDAWEVAVAEGYKKVTVKIPSSAPAGKVLLQVIVAKKDGTTLTSSKALDVNYAYVEIAADYDNNPSTPATKLKWAKMNLGATAENNWGDYFAWGETTPRYTSYTRKTDNTVTFNGYKDGYSGGYTYPHADYSGTILDAAHDAATANWGGTWRTPTQAEFQAMYNATKWTWDSTDNGYYVTAKDVTLAGDKSNALLFFPAAGYFGGMGFGNGGTHGYYWSSSLSTGIPSFAYLLCFNSSNVDPSLDDCRYFGFTVRPVSE